jgi:hypothetical protein
VNRVVRTNEEISSDARQLSCRLQHEIRNALGIIAIETLDAFYLIAIGRPGEPEAPLNGVGVKINRNS